MPRIRGLAWLLVPACIAVAGVLRQPLLAVAEVNPHHSCQAIVGTADILCVGEESYHHRQVIADAITSVDQLLGRKGGSVVYLGDGLRLEDIEGSVVLSHPVYRTIESDPGWFSDALGYKTAIATTLVSARIQLDACDRADKININIGDSRIANVELFSTIMLRITGTDEYGGQQSVFASLSDDGLKSWIDSHHDDLAACALIERSTPK